MFRFPRIHVSCVSVSKGEDLLGKEWLITDGLGGYASSTVLGVNTRKYHGLLVAAFRPPRKRMVCITKFDEDLILEGFSYPLYANEFQDGIRPANYCFPESFSLSPFPKYVYSLRNVKVLKTVFMPHGKNVTVILYEVENRGSSDVDIVVYPSLACRHFHAVLDKYRSPQRFTQKALRSRVNVNAEEPSATVIITSINGIYNPSERWIERVYYREEHLRGESFMEDWYQPGFFKFKAHSGCSEKFALIAAAGEEEVYVEKTMDEMPERIQGLEDSYFSEVRRYENLIEKFYAECGEKCAGAGEWLSWIIYATDIFIVETISRLKGVRRSVIAGYHWFEDWGRDTFISLPGLMLVTGRFEDARKTFLAFNEYSLNGLIPNFISDLDSKADYNALDATLWYVNAVLQYLKYTGDFAFVERELWDGIKTFAENLLDGKYEAARVDDDGLILHGPRMTWMDTVIDGKPVTPRSGKAVEIQALWFNALKTLELLAKKFNESSRAERFAFLADKAKDSFNEKFWYRNGNYLFDVVDYSGRGDPSIRPNQVIAVSLDFNMLDKARSKMVVEVAHKELLTPCGLRTLAKSDPRYIGVYQGDRWSRDLAYHNGTVWPWLLGPFVTAYLKNEGYSDAAREYAFKNFLLPLFSEQTFKAGLGVISEIFDGDPPHIPRGCIAQAWSVAEPLRAYLEDVVLLRPKFERYILQTH